MIPRFDSVDLGDGVPPADAAALYADAVAALGAAGAEWETPELITVPPLFTDADLAGLDFLDTRPGLPPFLLYLAAKDAQNLIALSLSSSVGVDVNLNIT